MSNLRCLLDLAATVLGRLLSADVQERGLG